MMSTKKPQPFGLRLGKIEDSEVFQVFFREACEGSAGPLVKGQ
jgi:hypothetical protein